MWIGGGFEGGFDGGFEVDKMLIEDEWWIGGVLKVDLRGESRWIGH